MALIKRLLEAQLIIVILAGFGALYLVEHAAKACGYTTEVRMPVVFHHIDDGSIPTHTIARN